MSSPGGVWNALNPYREPRQHPFRTTLLGPIERVADPVGQVLSTDEAKAHLRITFSNDDTLIDSLIQECTRLCEEEISGTRQFLFATYDLPVSHWWWDKPLGIPRPPLASVTSVKYFDTAGVQQTLPTTFYDVHTPWKMPGYIVRKPLQVFPPHQIDQHYPITIRFVAGYGAAADVPYEAKAAVKLLLFDRYLVRGTIPAPGSTGVVMPYGIQSLLESLSTSGYA